MRSGMGLGWAALLVACAGPQQPPIAPLPAPEPEAYAQEIRQWREQRADRLGAPLGWLRLAGLFWLEAGESVIGSDEGADLRFPASAPPRLGAVTRHGAQVTLTVAPGVEATCDGQPVQTVALRPDSHAQGPNRIVVGPLTFFLIERSGRLGIRLYDADAPAVAAFKGFEYFPLDPRYRVTAHFEPFAEPRTVMLPTVIQTEAEATVPGELVFEIDGQPLRLQPVAEEGEDTLFIVFGDATSGTETYGGGRFLLADRPDAESRVLLDFNKAFNPPCAVTPFATCPMARPENRLPVRIEAGEKAYGEVH